MFFLALAALLSLPPFIVRRLRGGTGWRAPLRVGIGMSFLLTGIDHFISADARYVPMIPPFLGEWALELVLLSGALEFAGGVALLVPRASWKRFGLPNLRPIAGLCLMMLLSVMVIANGHMASAGLDTAGLSAGGSYLVLRPFLQPFIILWVLFASEAIFPPRPVEGPQVSC